MSKKVTLDQLYNTAPTTIIKQSGIENSNIADEQVVHEEQKQISQPVRTQGSSLKSASISEISKTLPAVEQEEVKNPEIVDDAFKNMFNTLEERKEKIQEELVPVIMKNAEDIALENELGKENAEEQPSLDIDEEEYGEDESYNEIEDTRTVKHIVEKQEEKPKNKVKKVNHIDDFEDEEDGTGDLDELLKSLDDDEEDIDSDINAEEESNEEALERFKDSLSNVSISKDMVDLSTFKIRKKPTSSSNLLAKVEAKKSVKTADWALFHSKKSITFSECSGPELDNLRKSISRSNGINSVIITLKFVYNHIIDANKPPFEVWAKTIRTEDVESLYFGLYRACYADVNYVNRLCSKDDNPKACGKSSIIDIDIDTMVKYKDDETKKEFNKIFSGDTTTETDEVESIIIQISDDIAISYRHPTIYSTFMQYSTLNPNITKDYEDVLNTLAYIDEFYEIDRSTMELIPIDIKEYPTNFNKTVLSRLKTYIKILKSLTSDQYNMLIAKLSNLIEEPKVTYVYPEIVCPECGAKIPESDIQSVLQLIFTRAQLVQIKSL